MKVQSHQKKLVLLSLSLLAALLLSWNLAVKKTWNSYRDLRVIRTELGNMDSSEKMVRELELQLAKTGLPQEAKADSGESKLIFKMISDLVGRAGGVKIMQFPEVHRCSFDECRIETMKLELEGDFFNLLTLVHRMENDPRIGEMASVGFKLIRDYKQNKQYLRLTIYIQNLHK